MKPSFEKVPSEAESSFQLLHLDQQSFDAAYHFHPEFELTFIRRSHGRRYIGSAVDSYGPGDLVLVGANTPHCWISEGEAGDHLAQATVIQFAKNFAGEQLLSFPEMRSIRNLLENTTGGILFRGADRDLIASKMEKCSQAVGVERLAAFLEVLGLAAAATSTESVDVLFPFIPSAADTERISRVYACIVERYQQDLSIKEVANAVHLTPTAFCRYFKSVTRKTFIEAITEFRLNQARRLLTSTSLSVFEVCFESGFGNLSYFTKCFKKATGITPLQYRRKFQRR